MFSIFEKFNLEKRDYFFHSAAKNVNGDLRILTFSTCSTEFASLNDRYIHNGSSLVDEHYTLDSSLVIPHLSKVFLFLKQYGENRENDCSTTNIRQCPPKLKKSIKHYVNSRN